MSSAQSTRPAPTGPATYAAADLDRRFYAFVVDRLIAWGLYAGGAWLAYVLFAEDGPIWAGVVVALTVVLGVGAGFAALLGRAGVSPGKAMAGLRVVHPTTGAPIGVDRALLRALILAVAAVPTLGLGVVVLAWSALVDPGGRRRGWHDHLAHSVVLDVRPLPVRHEVEECRPREVVNLTALRLMPGPSDPAEPGPCPPPPRPARPSPSARPATATGWRITVDTGETFVVDGLTLVGRRPTPREGEPVERLVPLRSADMSVSKTHAQLQVVPDGSLVTMDRGSTSGSVLVRQGIARTLAPGRPATLLEGDMVRLGDRRMTVGRAG